MSITSKLGRILLAGTAATLAALPAFAEQGDIPNHIAVPASVARTLATGDFAAKIMPRQGYRGPVLFGHLKNAAAAKAAPPAGNIADSQADWSPADLGYFGGAYLPSASHVNVFWGEPNSATWGYPDSYETSLNNSTMIHVLDQYVNTTANARYPVAGVTWSGGSPGSYVSQGQIVSLAQGIAAADVGSYGQPGGYNNIIHIFLPPGTDTCFADNSACYNPDGRAPGPFKFCGYHSSTSVNGVEVLYTVEPYAHVSGCSATSSVAYDTANVLGHEISETITDPNPGSGWKGANSLNYGSEIGDECAWRSYWHYLNGTWYLTQDEYENSHHACGDTP